MKTPHNSPNGSKIPFPAQTPTPGLLNIPGAKKASAEMPPELKEIDGAPIAALADNNKIEGSQPLAIAPGGGGVLSDTDFVLHSDGTVMKYIDRPNFEPHCLLLDGAGRQYGVVRNPSVADLICNGVNMMHLARVQLEAEIAEQAREKQAGAGAPNLITQPHAPGANGNIIIDPSEN